MLFDTFHVLYMVISVALTVGLLILFGKVCKTDGAKNLTLKLIAVLVVIVHYSELWVSYLTKGIAMVDSPMLFPIYPCNVMMWLLLLTAFIKNRDTIFYRMLSEFVVMAGTVCGILGIVLNENYAAGGLDSYGVFSGLFSHSVMILGCLYLFFHSKVKFSVFNVISVASGLLLFIINGAVINTIFHLAGQETPNSMYLIEAPFASMPWVTTITIGIAALLLVFVFTVIFEQIAYRPEDRWYRKLKNIFKNQKIKSN